MTNNKLCTLEQAIKLKSLGFKGAVSHYWVNMAAWGNGYELMEAEEAEHVVRGCSFAEMDDTYPAPNIETATKLIEDEEN